MSAMWIAVIMICLNGAGCDSFVDPRNPAVGYPTKAACIDGRRESAFELARQLHAADERAMVISMCRPMTGEEA